MSAGEQTGISQWLDWLKIIQNDCNSGTTNCMDKRTFANTTIVAPNVLPTANEQNQFILQISNDLNIQVALSDLTTYPTFKALLDHFILLEMKVRQFLQALAAPPFPAGTLTAFDKAKTSAAFPGGSAGQQWQSASAALIQAFPPECYTAADQAKAAAIVDDPAGLVSALVKQISALG